MDEDPILYFFNMNWYSKTRINFYLDYPKHSYYQIRLNPNKESPRSIITTIIQKLYPVHLHSYSTVDPSFIHVQAGTVLDPRKTFSENGVTAADSVPDIRIRLAINVLPWSELLQIPLTHPTPIPH